MNQSEKSKTTARKGISRQINTAMGFIILIIILMNAIFLFTYNLKYYLSERFDDSLQVGLSAEKELESYQSLKFIVNYWETHKDTMDKYYGDQERVMKEEAMLAEKLGGMTDVKDVTMSQAEALDEEGQKLLAQICYSKLSSAFDTRKQIYKPLYLYSFRLENNEINFLVTGRAEDELRLSQGGFLYELGSIGPYERGWYPILDKILDTQQPASSLELSLQRGANRSVVHNFIPVYQDGEIVMIVGVSVQWKDLINTCLAISAVTLIVSTVLFILVGVGNHLLVMEIAVKPLDKEQKIIHAYEDNKNSGLAIKELEKINSGNEVETLAESFSSMVGELDRYMDEIRDVTAEQERLGAEVEMAAGIQESQLPNTFPAFPERKDFDINAYMHPAKEVGGDFYDFYMVDDDHLALVIADVSGKGVPGALFMMISRVLIKDQILEGNSPGETLSNVNGQLLENNGEGMFVTVWLAVIDLKTGKAKVANAGHEHPVVKRAGGDYELVVYRHSPAVAVMEDIPFKEHDFEVHKGDVLFVYTDGVPEATNASEELFGTDRLLEALNADKEAGPKQMLTNVKKAVDDFVGDAEQFDDLTMLAFLYKGPEG